MEENREKAAKGVYLGEIVSKKKNRKERAMGDMLMGIKRRREVKEVVREEGKEVEGILMRRVMIRGKSGGL